jgi:hypothetical protein
VMGWLYRDRRTQTMVARHGSQRPAVMPSAAPPRGSI